ncbi:hypothetical protein A1O3_08790 [Capronia epimyces CBS 606.96]|uniref:Piwi domain-containing protein n=1 Tax=Capronia epimyces CBS 606.96 TaxID=1182542 RepID=W9XGC2_9EURO|nr:uncharacterized protein A1O3_08790 [Capronia epimyces CBS 606.96]EXJ79288.1 hypothetical protein A1O3_08790 [Capronia epimyces CBS 606.96]
MLARPAEALLFALHKEADEVAVRMVKHLMAVAQVLPTIRPQVSQAEVADIQAAVAAVVDHPNPRSLRKKSPHHPTGPPAHPDAVVKKIEDETAKNIASTQLQARLPLRPGYGTQGKEVLLWANYFKVLVDNQPLYLYSIEVQANNNERKPQGKKMKRIVELLLESHLAASRANIATDFKSRLISRDKLTLAPGYGVTYREDDQGQVGSNARHYNVQLKYFGTISAANLLDHLTSTNASTTPPSRETLIQALNIIVGYGPKAASHIASLGMNRHFDLTTTQTASLDIGLTAVRGFACSIRAATGGLIANVQVNHTAFYNEGNLAQLMVKLLDQRSKFELAKFLHKVSVKATHTSPSKVKTIAGLATRTDGAKLPHPPQVPEFGANPQAVKFWLANEVTGQRGSPATAGRYISVHDFFREKYNRRIQYPKLPVINVGTAQDPVFIPPEFCNIIAGQAYRMMLNPLQTDKMIRFACREPNLNAQSITGEGARMLGFEGLGSPTLVGGPSSLEPRCPFADIGTLASLQHADYSEDDGSARSCPGNPIVKYGGGRAVNVSNSRWNLQNIKLTQASKLESWTYCWVQWKPARQAPWRDEEAFRRTLDVFAKALRNVGIQCGDCVKGRIAEVTQNDLSSIDETLHQITTSTSSPPKLVLVILPAKNQEMYKRFKYVCDIKEGIINVCVVAAKFVRQDAQTFANVALKINLKLGGRNQALDPAKLGLIAEGKTMVVGLDVTHPSPGSSPDAPSVVAIVASVDRLLAQWPAKLAVQDGRKEMVSNLKALMKSRLGLWSDSNNGQLPDKILLYRDGVSEGQYQLVLDSELPHIRAACREMYPADHTRQGLPLITIIVVGKRHNTRFYPTTLAQADRKGNPQNGTVVDRGVTEARNWDFFMQAHSAIQGTARPAHYYVVHDEIFHKRTGQSPFRNAADALEDVTHNMCYLFGRSTTAVSVCPPAYYADLVCNRARGYLADCFEPAASASGSVAGGGGGTRMSTQEMVTMHDNVRDSMFYI